MGEKSVNLNSFVLSGFGQESIILGVHLSNTCSRIREWKTWFITRLLLYDAVFEYFSTGRQLIRLYSKNYLNSDIVFHFDETFSNPKNSRFFIPLDSNLRPSCSGEHQIAWSLPSRQRALPNGLLHIRVSFAKLSRPIFHPFTNPTGLTHSDGHAIIQFIPGCFYNICQHDCTMETNNVR